MPIITNIDVMLARRKMSSGEAAAAVMPCATSRPGKSRAMAGTMPHQTRAEPQQMMKAYFNPTM